MDIKQAKQQITYTMQAYFAKDQFGGYIMPPQRQRPIFLLGAPGIGKTAIVEQIAQELDVGFVAYSMTHHTRQSALGLPFIVQKSYGGQTFDVSEYTMSEIIAAVYDAMEQTGHREGILFLDEINCVSETLTPAMLQFLQYKVFGRHKVPEGWIVVTAGNPPEYNRTARDFDLATWDRLKRIDVQPDYQAWRDYAVEHGVHPAVITYLDVEQEHFYHLETTVEGKEFVTARGWDDLSSAIKLYEAQDLPVDEVLIGQYVQAPHIAKRFAVYYDLFTKYRSDYQINHILDATAGPDVLQRAKAAPFDERVSLVGLLSDALSNTLREAVLEQGAAEFLHPRLAAMRDELAENASEQAIDAVRAQEADIQKLLRTDRASGLLSEQKYRSYQRALEVLAQAQRLGAQAETVTFEHVKAAFNQLLDNLDSCINTGSSALDNALAFAEQAFGEGQELLLLITDLSANRYSMAFINAHGCERFFAHNKSLQFDDRGAELAQRIKQTMLDNA